MRRRFFTSFIVHISLIFLFRLRFLMLTEREATAGSYFSRENKVSQFVALLSGDFAVSL